MEEDFNIHLISNVSHDVFPNNSPSEFSTLLANEISLNGNGWEVAVRDIMYPSNLVEEELNDKVTTYKSKIKEAPKRFPRPLDKDNFVKPACIDFSAELYKTFPSLYPTKRKPKPKAEGKPETEEKKKETKYKDVVGLKLVKKLNSLSNKWGRIFEFQYLVPHSKFILHVYKEDVLVTLTSNLANVLGFKPSVHFFRGSTWAWNSWHPEKLKLKRNASKIYLMDILTMQDETYEMNQETDLYIHKFLHHYKYSIDIPYKLHGLDDANLKNLIPKDYKFTLTLLPFQGSILLSSKTPLLTQHLPYHNSFSLYSFDEETRKILKIPKYLVFETRFDADSRLVKNFNTRLIRLRYPNYVKHTDLLKQIDLLKQHKPKLTLYSTQLRKLPLVPDLLTEKIIDVKLPAKKPIGEMIKALNENSMKNGYTFSYSPQSQRISLLAKETHFVRMSSTLSLKLGFENANEILFTNRSMEANHFPLFHKDVHDLYVYTNIVEPVYVGNVKAPLLLACPLKKDSQMSYLTHLEFQNPTYQKLNRNVFREIEISIHDAFGKLIEFDYGRTVLNLHFRKT